MTAPAASFSTFACPGSAASTSNPDVTGFGVDLPIVLMTGYGDVPMSVRAMKAGAVDFLPKPFRDQDMIDAVMAALERDRERRVGNGAAADIRNRYASLSERE